MSSTIESHDVSSVRDTVTKLPVMNTDATPSSSRMGATATSAVSASTYVAGPPTGEPTVNFIALGFGVLSTTTATATFLVRTANRSGGGS